MQVKLRRGRDRTDVGQYPGSVGVVVVAVLAHGLVVKQRDPVDTTADEADEGGAELLILTTHFRYMPILMRDAITDPSTSPKKRPTWQQRSP